MKPEVWHIKFKIPEYKRRELISLLAQRDRIGKYKWQVFDDIINQKTF